MRISDWSSAVCSSDLDGDDVRGLAVADEGLLTAQPKAARHPASAGADRLEVRSGARLGHRDRADPVAVRHRRQPALLLGLGAVGEDIVRDDARTHAVGDSAGTAQPGSAHFLSDLSEGRLVGTESVSTCIYR